MMRNDQQFRVRGGQRHNLGLFLLLSLGATLFPSFTPGIAFAQAQFTFGLWGDMPYARNGDGPKIPALIRSINASDIAFSLNHGDIKDGSSKCTDDVFDAAKAMFNSIRQPVVYVPGDNEWTDCHRLNNGGYDNLERLDYLRTTMFARPESFGQNKLRLEQQGTPGGKFSENSRFAHEGILFVGLNVPGSNNNKVLDEKDCHNRSARQPVHCEKDNVEYVERDRANIDWLAQAFAIARQQSLSGIVLVIQADPGFDLPETEEIDERRAPSVSGYTAFLDAVARETQAFAGQVLFVHGDTHYFKIDKPLLNPSKMIKNFTRLQTFGSPHIHWIKVTVDRTRSELFVISPVYVEGN
jgi:hypothetical protein